MAKPEKNTVDLTRNMEPVPIVDSYVLTRPIFRDDRGSFSEAYNSVKSEANGEPTRAWKQVSISESVAHVIRGIHVSKYGKFTSCLSGSLDDYIVDLREDSPSYLQWFCLPMSANNGKQLYIPPGCGHAFLAGENGCTIMYLQEGTFDPPNEMDVAWDDPVINIKWRIPDGVTPIISDKDKKAPKLVERRPNLPFSQPRKRVLIIGASGQVGNALKEEFSGYNCMGTYNTQQNDPCLTHCDMFELARNPSAAKLLLDSMAPDVVCICSAMTWVEGCEDDLIRAYAVNSTAPGLIAEAAKEVGAKVVHYSTDYVFDGTAGPYTETDKTCPLNVYGKSKLEGEQRVLKATPEALVLRTTGVYGPDKQSKNFVCQLMKNSASGSVMKIPNDQFGCPTYNKDIAKATRLLIEAGASGVFNVVGPDLYERHAFALETASILDLDAEKFVAVGTSEMRQKASRPLKAGLNTTKLSETLPDFKMQTLKEALKDWAPQVQSYYANTQATRPSASKKVWYAPHKFEAYGEDEIKAVEKCLRNGWLAPGPLTAEFEAQVSAYFGKKCGVMVNSGSSANLIGLAVLDLKPGAEIITPACTFSTCIAPMEQLGLKPVFIDVEVGRYVPSVDAILGAITPNTGCIFIPNLVGSKIDWEDLRARMPADRKDIILFEDSCDTMTHTTCTDLSVISFYASHIITAGGCGGVVMFNDMKLHAKALMYRDWGRIGNNSEEMSERFGHDVDGIPYDFKFLYGVLGYNMKACEMNAAFGLEQMKKLGTFTQMRKANIDRYVTNLSSAGTSYILPVNHNAYDWLAFPLMITKGTRMDLLQFMEENDVQVRVIFAGNITRHPVFRHYLQDFPISDNIMATGFLL
eukprot:gene13305-15723_t